MPIAEVTVQAILPAGRKSPSGKTIPFDAIVTAEQGTISLQRGQVNNFKINHCCEVGYTEKGEYKNDGTFLKDLTTVIPSPKQNVRPATNPADSDRMATMGMVNAMLNGICYGRPITELLQIDPTDIAKLINLCNAGLERSVIKGKQAQTRHDFDDQIPFP